MDIKIIIVLLMNFIVTYIGTLAYAVRIVGVRTGRIAISFSLFNVLVLVSRLASNIQAPLLDKYTEIAKGIGFSGTFYNILIAGAMATAAGAVSIPTFQRVFTQAVNRFSTSRSVPRILVHGFSKDRAYQTNKIQGTAHIGHADECDCSCCHDGRCHSPIQSDKFSCEFEQYLFQTRNQEVFDVCAPRLPGP
jgi:hypothetical protein